MKPVKVRNVIVNTHRYLGLMVGLILVIVGLTGSLLVFEHEIDEWQLQQRFGNVTAQTQQVSPEVLVNNVKTAYAVGVGEAFASAKASPLENRPNWQVGQLQMLPKQQIYTVRLNRPDDTQWEVFVNPYTGKIIGDRQRETALFSRVLSLHYELLAGQIGMTIVGIAALFLCILTVTGTLLWSGWRKLLLAHIPHFNFYDKYLDLFATHLRSKYADKN